MDQNNCEQPATYECDAPTTYQNFPMYVWHAGPQGQFESATYLEQTNFPSQGISSVSDINQMYCPSNECPEAYTGTTSSASEELSYSSRPDDASGVSCTWH